MGVAAHATARGDAARLVAPPPPPSDATAQQQARAELENIYSRHAPRRVENVDTIMSNWEAKGRPLSELLSRVRAKYR
jgi:hypothetical protein